jgi:hypothetical protein
MGLRRIICQQLTEEYPHSTQVPAHQEPRESVCVAGPSRQCNRGGAMGSCICGVVCAIYYDDACRTSRDSYLLIACPYRGVMGSAEDGNRHGRGNADRDP